MRISYNKLWKLLIDKDMTKMELKDAAGISAASIAKLGKGANITTDVLLKICETLHWKRGKYYDGCSFENLRNPSLPHRGYP